MNMDEFMEAMGGKPQQRVIKLTDEQCDIVAKVLQAVEGLSQESAETVLAVAGAYIKHHANQMITMLGASDGYKAGLGKGEEEDADG